MAYDAKVFNIMIACPSDVAQERKIVKEVIYQWNSANSANRGIVLLPIGWESNSSPDMGDRAQEIINRQVLSKCDLLVGVFWTRIGTSTGGFVSGTVEEIEKQIVLGKPVMIYFSEQPVVPDSLNPEQYVKLKQFQESIRDRGLYETYDDAEEFRDKFRHQLQLKINEHQLFKDVVQDNPKGKNQPAIRLSPESKTMLKEAVQASDGTLMYSSSFSSDEIIVNGRNVISDTSARGIARWKAALRELVELGLVADLGKGEVFEMTDLGYQTSDALEAEDQKPMFVKPFYWLSKGSEKEGPFCSTCYDKDGKLIHLYEYTAGWWECNVCKSRFSEGSHDDSLVGFQPKRRW